MRIESNPRIRVYKNVHYQCDTCGIGNMMFTGMIRDSYPPKYDHICSNCGVGQMLSVQYPTEIYEERKV